MPIETLLTVFIQKIIVKRTPIDHNSRWHSIIIENKLISAIRSPSEAKAYNCRLIAAFYVATMCKLETWNPTTVL